MTVELLQKALEEKLKNSENEQNVKFPKINPLASLVMSAANTAVPGSMTYIPPALASLADIAQTELGIGGKPKQSYLPGGYKKEFNKNLDFSRKLGEESISQNPLSSFVGGVGGMFIPGSLTSKFFGGASNLAMRGAPALEQGAGALTNLGRALNIIGRSSAGVGLASVPYSQVMSLKPFSDVQGRANEAITQGGFGALAGGLGGTISSGAQATKIGLNTPRGQAIYEAAKSLPFGIGKFVDKLGNIISAPETAKIQTKYAEDLIDADKKYLAQKASIEAEKRLAKELNNLDYENQQKTIQEAKDTALQSVKTFQQADNKTIGEQFANWFNNKAAKFKETFNDLKSGVLKSFGGAKADTGALSIHIDDVLQKDFGLSNDLSNFKEQVSKIVDPERFKVLKNLVTIKNSLSNQEYTLKELDSLRQQLQGLADYSAKIQTPYNVLYSDLSKTADLSFKNNLNNYGGTNAVSNYEKANEIYSKNIDIYNTLKTISESAPEKIIKNARSNFTGSFIDNVKTLQPELSDPVKNIILNDIAQNVRNPDQMSKIIDTYGRDSLNGLFGEKEFSKILQVEENLKQAFAKKAIQQQLPQSIMLAAAKKGVVEKPVLPNALETILNSAISKSKLLTNGQIQVIFNNLLKNYDAQNKQWNKK